MCHIHIDVVCRLRPCSVGTSASSKRYRYRYHHSCEIDAREAKSFKLKVLAMGRKYDGWSSCLRLRCLDSDNEEGWHKFSRPTEYGLSTWRHCIIRSGTLLKSRRRYNSSCCVQAILISVIESEMKHDNSGIRRRQSTDIIRMRMWRSK